MDLCLWENCFLNYNDSQFFTVLNVCGDEKSLKRTIIDSTRKMMIQEYYISDTLSTVFFKKNYLINGPHGDVDKLLIGVVVTGLHFSCLDNALVVLILS